VSTHVSDVMPFSKHLGIEIITATPDRVEGRMVVRPEMCTVNKMVHGGAIMAFADSLGAVAAFICLPEGANGTTTIESKTNFLGPAEEGATLLAETTPVQIGRRLSVWQTRITREDGKAVAMVTQTQLVL
jgi:1,4-dihydroxy-2-naphthoyl-CoA hydrolase